MKTKHIHIRVTEAEYEKLKRLQKKQRRTMTEIILAWLKKEKE